MQAFHQALAQRIIRHAAARDADHAEIVRQQTRGLEIIERRDDEAVREVAGDAENHESAGVGFSLVRRLRLICHARPASGLMISFEFAFRRMISYFGSLWPPNPARIAERIFSAKV